jgi:hypothetical protein
VTCSLVVPMLFKKKPASPEKSAEIKQFKEKVGVNIEFFEVE